MKPHRARILAMQAVYQAEFNYRSLSDLTKYDWVDYKLPPEEQTMAKEIIYGVREKQEELDKIIRDYSQNWEFGRISYVSRAIIRVSLYQLLYMKDQIPMKVAIDEAVRLAQEYAEDDAGRFVNGVLDAFVKDAISP